MCKVFFEKCVCFVLFTVLLILSCSGFPTDKPRAMPFFNAVIQNNLVNRTSDVNYIRHHRLQHTPHPMGHINAFVIPNTQKIPPLSNSPLSKSTHPNSQISPIVFNRYPRSHNHKRKNKLRLLQRQCDNEHFSVKAFKSRIVLHVNAQSVQSSKRNRSSYSVYFKVIRRLKTSNLPIHDGRLIHLKFSNASNTCDGGRVGRRNLVRADIRASQEYILFLDKSPSNEYLVTSAPELIKKKKHRDYLMKILDKVCSPNFRPKPASIKRLEDKSTWRTRGRRLEEVDQSAWRTPYRQHYGTKRRKQRLKLVCRAAGLPFPRIVWRKDNVTISDSKRVRISYVKRRSTLKIPNPTDAEDSGRYECSVRGEDRTNEAKTVQVRVPELRPITTPTPFSEIDSRKPCEAPFDTSFCLNNGQCYMDPDPLERYCECPNGFSGPRCEAKTSYQPASMYPPHPYYTCKLGLSTKYYC